MQGAFAGNLHQHDRRAHRDRATDEQRLHQVPPHEQAGAGADGHGEADLERRPAEDAGADRAKLAEAELEADAEHQERHADVGEGQHVFAVGDESRRRGSHGQPGQDVAEHGRQAQPVRDRPQGKRRNERDEQGQLESHYGMDRLSAARRVVGGMSRSYRPSPIP